MKSTVSLYRLSADSNFSEPTTPRWEDEDAEVVHDRYHGLLKDRFVSESGAVDAWLVWAKEQIGAGRPAMALRHGHAMGMRDAMDFGWEPTDEEWGRLAHDVWVHRPRRFGLGAIEHLHSVPNGAHDRETHHYEWRLVDHGFRRMEPGSVDVWAVWDFRLMVPTHERHTVETAAGPRKVTVDAGHQPWRPWARWKWPGGGEVTEDTFKPSVVTIPVVGNIAELEVVPS